MSTPPAALSSSPIEPEKSWFARHLLVTIIMGLAIAFTAFVVVVLGVVMMSLRSSDVYREAVARAQQAPAVRERLGTPIEAGWFTSGSINVSGPSGSADLAIPISGPTGKATIYVVGKKRMGRWELQALEVAVEGQAERVRLPVGAASVQEQ
ncbi:MAG: cytochrome c oxidase assembly factor 1 family protein [Acidobacteriia bacterium]|nr:cytochrome c oxidase assembly factor 1 family protein [Terriglobia bacterium]